MKYNWDKERVQEAIKISDSFNETLRNLHIPTFGNNAQTLKRKIKEYDIDISHFSQKKHYQSGITNLHYISAQEYIDTHNFITSSKLKDKLFKEHLKENKCERCGISEWQGYPIVCQLHHIDGNNQNNNLDNLQILCPNCHSLTENYCGKVNQKKHYYCQDCGVEITRSAKYCTKCKDKHNRKVERPSKEELINLFKEIRTFSGIGKKFNVSDNTIKKWFKYYNLPYKVRDLKCFLKENLL